MTEVALLNAWGWLRVHSQRRGGLTRYGTQNTPDNGVRVCLESQEPSVEPLQRVFIRGLRHFGMAAHGGAYNAGQQCGYNDRGPVIHDRFLLKSSGQAQIAGPRDNS